MLNQNSRPTETQTTFHCKLRLKLPKGKHNEKGNKMQQLFQASGQQTNYNLQINKAIKEQFGEKKIGEIKVSQVLGGMRGMTGLFYETSKLDAQHVLMI